MCLQNTSTNPTKCLLAQLRSAEKIFALYPKPIVDEKLSAKRTKDIISEIKKRSKTKDEARQVFLKHGSRKTLLEKEKDKFWRAQKILTKLQQ